MTVLMQPGLPRKQMCAAVLELVQLGASRPAKRSTLLWPVRPGDTAPGSGVKPDDPDVRRAAVFGATGRYIALERRVQSSGPGTRASVLMFAHPHAGPCSAATGIRPSMPCSAVRDRMQCASQRSGFFRAASRRVPCRIPANTTPAIIVSAKSASRLSWHAMIPYQCVPTYE